MPIPVGTVAAVSVQPPDGVLLVDHQTWLQCDGRPVPREQFDALHDVVGEVFGAPDDQSFNLPDLRGRFIRGVDDSPGAGYAGRDPDSSRRSPMQSGGLGGLAVGSVQPDEVAQHQHHLTGTWGTGVESDKMAKLNGEGPGDAGTTQSFGAGDTRPTNASVCFVILAADPNGTTSAPVGGIMSYGGTTDPGQGWTICDGRRVSRSESAAAHALLGDAFGSGDGVSTFNLPDLRGYFVRGVDGGSGRDKDAQTRTAPSPGGATGAAPGSVQGHSFDTHAHPILGTSDQVEHDGGSDTQVKSSDPSSGGDAGQTDTTGGTETRPRNAYLHYIMRLT
jgi:microcystin-dependent protein